MDCTAAGLVAAVIEDEVVIHVEDGVEIHIEDEVDGRVGDDDGDITPLEDDD